MIGATTLATLACLIANKGPLDTSALENQLSAQEMAQVESIIDSGACIPANIERLLRTTQAESSKKSPQGHYQTEGHSTDGCFEDK